MNKEIKEHIKQAKSLGCNGVLVFNLGDSDKTDILKKGMDYSRETEHDFVNGNDTYEGYIVYFDNTTYTNKDVTVTHKTNEIK